MTAYFLSLFLYYIWPQLFCIISTFHALWCQPFSRLWASNKLSIPRCSHFPLPPADISSRQKAACRASFGILLCANLLLVLRSWRPTDSSPMTLAPLSPSSLLPWLPWLSGSPMQQDWNIWYNPPSLKTSAFCVAVIISLLDAFYSPHQVPLRFPACLGQHGGNGTSGMLVHMWVLAILQMELYLRHSTTFSQITARSGICIYEQSVQTDSSRKAVMVWPMCPWRDDTKYWRKKSYVGGDGANADV